MSFQNFVRKAVVAAFAATCVFAAGAAGQRPALVITNAPPRADLRIAERNNVYCAGYVQTAPVDTSRKIIGGYNEQEQFLYSENNFVYLSGGSNRGYQVGDLLTVIRPRGTVKTKWSRKDNLGFYVQEVGALEVVRVKGEVSVAKVKTSCASLLLGDLVQPMATRVMPAYSQRPPLDLFGDANGKAIGRLFMARDGLEMVSRENIVYIDLGAEDNVRVGDYLTVFRPLGKGHVMESDEDENIEARVSDFGSEEFDGGEFSNQAPRKSGDRARGRIVTTDDAKEDRPFIRKVVGEMVILNVRERTATAVITRNAQEIHTGDYVEVQ